jgi:TatA/E family protein of Tat protein translocase
VLPGLGPVHLFMVLVVALLVLGPTKLPEVARNIGSAVNVFREMRDRMHADLSPRSMVQTVLEGPDEAGPDQTGMDQS